MPLRCPNVSRIEAKIRVLTDYLENAQTKEDAIKAVNKYFKIQNEVNTDFTIISINFTLNTQDPKIKKYNDTIDEISPIVNNYFKKFEEAMVKSKFRQDLENKFGKLLFVQIENGFKCFDEKIIPLLQEENKLVSDYQALLASAKIEYKGETLNLSQIGKYMSDKDPEVRVESAKLYYGFLSEHDEEIGTIYDKLVKLRDKMAKELGYSNYIEFGYLRLGRVDYNAQMVAGYREQIKRDVVPVVYKLRKNQAKRLGYKNPIFLDYNLFFEDGNAKPAGDTNYLVDCAQKMYNEMGTESGEFFKFMVDNHLMDLDAKAGKAGGGYMTFIPRYKSPFIFANSNGTSSDVDTLTHEVGHAFQGYLCRNVKIPNYQMPTLEACEIDSMSMEFFAYPWMNLFFKDGADKYRFAFRGYVEKGGEKFFHSDGRTAAVNISRVRKKLLLGQHFHRLLPCRRGGFFQIEFCGNGNDKHIKPARSRSSNERFVYAVYIFPERGGNLRARKRAAVVCMYFIVRTFFFDHPHCVCFRHNFTVE